MNSQIKEVLRGNLSADEYFENNDNPKKFTEILGDTDLTETVPAGTEVVIGLAVKGLDAIAIVDCSGVQMKDLLNESVDNGLRVKIQKQFKGETKAEAQEKFLAEFPDRVWRGTSE